ncbi:MAG TPA: hypothetical protein VFM93_13925 [Candidatus Limnocylindria bacterium]|nr:hypothetical protein [Candidatus Limnocylindria bacterium]
MFRRYVIAALAVTAMVSACGGASRTLAPAEAGPIERSGTSDPNAGMIDATIDAGEYSRTLADGAPSVIAECVANGDCILR